MTLELAFDLDLAHGRCVGVRLPHDAAWLDAALESLAAEERAYAVGLALPRRRGFVGGRVAMREVLARIGVARAAAILPDDRGAPALPQGVVGSISHKETIAVALATRDDGEGAKLGVDVELDVARRLDIARHVLTEEERRELDASADEGERGRELILRFSAKEAMYKAVDPFVRRYVAFAEAYVAPREDGSADARLTLKDGEPPVTVDVRWLRRGGFVLTTARVRVVRPR